MQYKNIFNFDIKITWKSISLFAFLAIFPNFLGMVNLPTVWGFKIHLFQYLVFLAAMLYGPFGGLISGAFGSVFTATALHNPYILIGNMILGFFVGFFFRLKWNIVLAVLVAYLIQLPWLYFTDVYLAGMPIKVVYGVMVALLISNLVWAFGAKYSYKHIRKAII